MAERLDVHIAREHDISRAAAAKLIEAGRVRPVIHARLPLAEAAAAHRVLEESGHVGKVLLTVAGQNGAPDGGR